LELPLHAVPQPGDGWQGELVGAMAQFADSLRIKYAGTTDSAERQRAYAEEAKAPGWARRFMGRDVDDSFNDYAQYCSFTEFGGGGAELCPGGAERELDIGSLDDFVECAAQWWLRAGIRPQVEAFRRGVEDVCASSAIWAFEPQELRELLCGKSATWTREELESDLQFSGFSSKENSAMLIEELDSMPLERRSRFAEFVTGCPRLPPGGLANAQIKIVELPDETDTLPRAHTCTHELQLPKYSSAAMLTKQLQVAMDGSQGMDDSQF